MGGLVILGQNPQFPWLHRAAQTRFACKFLLLGRWCEPGQEGEFGLLLLTLTLVFSRAERPRFLSEPRIELRVGSFIHIPRLLPVSPC